MPGPNDARIVARVPHRAPILRVHRVVAEAAGVVHLRGCEPQGPGALSWAAGAIEGLAQSAAVMLGFGLADADAAVAAGRRGMLVAVKHHRVLAEPAPGAEIDYHVRLVRRIGPTVMVAGRAAIGEQTLAEGELTLWIPPEPA
jgi:hypothetical protein